MVSKEFMDAIEGVTELHDHTGTDGSGYVVEECCELVKEICKYNNRKKGNQERIFDEACDVLCTVFSYLRWCGYSTESVRSQIIFKCKRALKNYKENGEL